VPHRTDPELLTWILIALGIAAVVATILAVVVTWLLA